MEKKEIVIDQHKNFETESRHVRTLGEALRNVDYVEISPTDLEEIISDFPFMGSGIDMFCFAVSDLNHQRLSKKLGSGNAVLLSTFNHIWLQNKVLRIVRNLIQKYPDIKSLLYKESDISAMNNEEFEFEVEERNNHLHRGVRFRVACHNALFIRGEFKLEFRGKTVWVQTYPINTILTIDGLPVGIIIKRIGGIPASLAAWTNDYSNEKLFEAVRGDFHFHDLIMIDENRGVIIDIDAFHLS